MRLLLTSNAVHHPPQGGSTRANLAWLAHAASSGHTCFAVAPTAGGATDRVDTVQGIEIRSYHELSLRHSLLSREIASLEPDWVLVSSEDVTHVLLREAARAAPGRLVYLAHTPQFFPFGPESWNPDPQATRIIEQSQAVVAIGRHMQGYIERYAGVTPHLMHPPIYGRPPWRQLGRFGSGWVLMLNPCAVKGLTIFLELARRFPDHEFAALAGWGTTSSDRAAMAKLANVRVLETVPDIESVLEQATVLLMPSLWYEGFGLIAMEAMLRGLPVVSSDSGGLQEAKEGTGYVIPVRGVERYLPHFDEKGMPEAVLPDQDISPWEAALQKLLTDEPAYQEEARRSRQAAERFVTGLRADGIVRLLETLPAAPVAPAPPARTLDAARRALLLERLRKNRA